MKGKKNGKGKDYDLDGKLIFEGEYLNGKKNGKGQEYDLDGIILFRGEYINGKKWNGIIYNNRDNISYELNDGKGYMIEIDYNNKLIFEGEYLNGEKKWKRKRI